MIQATSTAFVSVGYCLCFKFVYNLPYSVCVVSFLQIATVPYTISHLNGIYLECDVRNMLLNPRGGR